MCAARKNGELCKPHFETEIATTLSNDPVEFAEGERVPRISSCLSSPRDSSGKSRGIQSSEAEIARCTIESCSSSVFSGRAGNG